MVKPAILQVVGYQNSGKTTLMKKLITELRTRGIRTVTIKHHGHGGRPETPEGKDSTEHLSAGAVATIVEGDGGLVLQADRETWELDDQLCMLQYFKPDVILIEGHKNQHYPKVVILRSWEDQKLLLLPNIIAVVTCGQWDLALPQDRQLNVFLREEDTVISYLLSNLVEPVE